MGRAHRQAPLNRVQEPQAGSLHRQARWIAAAAAAGVVAYGALCSSTALLVPTSAGLFRGLGEPPSSGRWWAASVAGLLAAGLVRRNPRAGLPVVLLLLALLPLVTLLTGSLPLLLLPQGPALSLLLTAVIAVVVAGFRSRWSGLAQPRHGREPLLVVCAFSAFTLLGWHLPGPAGPQGDEPHYLLMTDSLLADGDLDLANQFAEKRYRSFFAGQLESHTSPASPARSLYQVHTPGLPILLAPGFALQGYAGARLLQAFYLALATACVHRLVREVTGSSAAALVAWAALTFTPPLPLYATSVYPEGPAALATALLLLAARQATGWRLVWATVAAAGLPWLHPKFLPLAFLGLGLAVLRPGPRWARIAASATLAVSVLGLLLFFQQVYGRASFSAAYGPGFADDLALRRIPVGLLALALDRQFGLVALAPLWLIALPGLASLLRERTGDTLRAVLLGGATLCVGAAFSMWWGGASPPGRFVVPALPALALGVARRARDRPRGTALLLGLGVGVLLLSALTPAALHNRADGESSLLRHLAPALDLDGRLPSFVAGTPWLALPLALALLAAIRGPRSAGAAAIAYGSWVTLQVPTPLLDARAAVAQLLDRWEPERCLALSGELDLSTLQLPLELPGAPWYLSTGDVQRSRRLSLPPGVYRLEIDARPGPAPTSIHLARLEVQSGPVSLDWVYLRVDRPLVQPLLPLVVGASRFTLVASGVASSSIVRSARLVPLELAPRSLRAELRMAVPDQERYRVGDERLRITVTDRSEPEGDGFRLAGAWGAFLIEAPLGAEFDVLLERPAPALGDVLEFGDETVALPIEAQSRLRLRNAAGLPFGAAGLLPLRVHSREALVQFRSAQIDAR